MTNEEKRELRDMVKRGLTLDQILKRTSAAKATVKKYIKVFRPNEKLRPVMVQPWSEEGG